MDAAGYLKSYGWNHGEALKQGGLRKPILVKHKKDTRGLGHDSNIHEAWWERVFDGQLKGLDVTTGGGASEGVQFNQREIKPSGISRHLSPLYRMFVSGGVLEGTIEQLKKQQQEDKEEEREKEKAKMAKKRKSVGSKRRQAEEGEPKEKSKKRRRSKDEDDEKKKKSKKKDSERKKKKSSSSSKKKDNPGEEWIRNLVKNMDQKVPVAS